MNSAVVVQSANKSIIQYFKYLSRKYVYLHEYCPDMEVTKQ